MADGQNNAAAGNRGTLQSAGSVGVRIDDALLAEVHRNMGQVYMDRRRWKKASRYFVLSKESEKLAECLFQMGDFTTLRELRGHVPDSSPVHRQLAGKYESLGMCEDAVDCYVKVRLCAKPMWQSSCWQQCAMRVLIYLHSRLVSNCNLLPMCVQAGMVQRAVDCCSRLNHWALAVDLAREHGMQAENLLEGRASQLRQHGRKVDEVNLFKKAEAHHRSAQVLVDLAKRAVVRWLAYLLHG